MAESDIIKNIPTEHHETIAHETDSDDSDIRIPESKHEDEGHGHSQEENQTQTRRNIMRSRLTTTLATLVVIIAAICGSIDNANAIGIQRSIKRDISDDIAVRVGIVKTVIQNDIATAVIGKSINQDGVVEIGIIS